MKKIIIIIVLFFFDYFKYKETDYLIYHQRISLAELAYLQHNYGKCTKLCHEAFKLAKPFVEQNRNDYYLLAKAYLKANDMINFKKYFEQALEAGLNPWLFNKDSSLFKENFQLYKHKVQNAFEKFCLKNDAGLIRMVHNASQKDQKYRLQISLGVIDSAWLAPFDTISDEYYPNYFFKFSSQAPKADKKVLDSLQNLQSNLDKQNFLLLSKYIEENGYPTYNAIGNNQNLLFSIILHFPKDYKKSLTQRWLREIKEGRISPHKIAMLVDDACIDAGKRPIYGIVKKVYNPQSGKSEKVIYNVVKTDSLRKKIGLCPLAIERQIETLNK